MSNDDTSDGTNEGYDIDGAGTYSVDDEDQLQSEDTLIDRGVDDVLDEGYSPPDSPIAVDEFGTTAAETAQGESLDQRLAREQPDPNLAFDDPLAEPVEADPDAPREQDDLLDDGVLDVGEVGDLRAGRLVAPDEGAHEDVDSELTAQDAGIDASAASAEEAAMHVIQD